MVVVASTVVPLAAMSRTVTPAAPVSAPSTMPLLLVSNQTRLPSESVAGMRPKSTRVFADSPLALVTTGSLPGVSVTGALTMNAPDVVPLSSLSTSLSGSTAGSELPPVLEVTPAGVVMRTR